MRGALTSILLTLPQALQLAGALQSVFLAGYLGVAGRSRSTLPAVLYFLGLACTFLVPLHEAFDMPALHAPLLAGDLFGIAFTYLLVLQLVHGRVPPAPHWLVLAVPAVGLPVVMAGAAPGEVCAAPLPCLDPMPFVGLYRAVAGGGVLLALMLAAGRGLGALRQADHGREKYALVMALIALTVARLAFDLAAVAGVVRPWAAQASVTVLALGFVYLVASSVLRVFPGIAAGAGPTPADAAADAVEAEGTGDPGREPAITEADRALAEQVEALLARDRLYRQPGFGRRELAAAAEVPEHVLSRAVNAVFRRRVNDLINSYRVEDAKTRLRQTDAQVSSIAFAVGFNSLSSFNRVFRQATGQAPRTWRREAARAPAETGEE